MERSSANRNDIELSIITVSTNEGKELEDCLASVFSGQEDVRFEYFVIDNGSTDSTADVLSRYPSVIPIRLSDKQGFASNNNMAIARSKGRYVLLLNPDTILQKGTLRFMIDYMDAHTDIGASTCKLVNPDDSVQYTARMFPSPVAVFMRWLNLDRIFPRSRVLSRYLLSDWDHETERDVDWIIGAFLLVRREVIEQVGMLDTSFDPLYYEDIDWCYRIKKAGWRIRYVPYVKVVHLYDRESARSFFNRMTFVHFRNIIRYFWKHRWGR